MELIPGRFSGWHAAPAASLTSHQKYWLLRPGALTNGLRALGEFNLRVARERVSSLRSDEAWMLARAPGSPIWLREICMGINGTDSVFARSFTPLHASHGLWQGMRRLRTRPLAEMLYHDPQITRSGFMVARLHGQHPIYRSMRFYFGSACPQPNRILARCSVFWRLGQPLLVAEAFLPAFWELAGNRRP